SSSSSSSRWISRQQGDKFARSAKLAGLKSRAAYKLLDINSKYHIFKPGQTVVDLGYAPGSWSQVSVNRTAPGGRVIGIDVIPAQPPRGVSTLQGDFTSPDIREEVRRFLRRPDAQEDGGGTQETEEVNVVLSDMCEPWPLVQGAWLKSISNPYRRMMNTTGSRVRDHALSMRLCLAALEFVYTSLAPGGHFVCKFYQGAEDGQLEKRLKNLFEKVHRVKPDSSRKESKEAYFVAIKRKKGVDREQVLD
ncbi:23S ribosomal RNA methyltransferase, partial [Piedraia hortae CBS 480.64]